MLFKDTPIQRKLMSIILLTSTVVILVMSTAYILFANFSFKESVQSKVSTLALVVASNSSAALAFESPHDATETLSALRADEHIVAACLYDREGKLFAKYPRTAQDSDFPVKPQPSGYQFKSTVLEGFQPVTEKNAMLGTLFIRSDMREIQDQTRFNIGIAVALMLGSLLIAFVLSRLLQRSISQPILTLERTAAIISTKGDYSVRAVKEGNDELGSLTDAFNHMLNQIETQNEQVLRANEESAKLAAIVESSGDAIIGTDLQMRINSWNKSAERILGYKAQDIIGNALLSLVPEYRHPRVGPVLTRLMGGELIEPFEAQMVSKNGDVLDISLTISAVRNSRGDVTGTALIARDVSEKMQQERLIAENEEHLRLATQAAELGTFDMDLVAGTMDWDKRCRLLFGIDHDREVTYEEDFLNGLHDEDRSRIDTVIKNAFDRSKSNGDYDVEYRTVSSDKRVRWVRAKGKVFFDRDDRPIRFIGTVLDITDKKTEELKKNDFIAIISHELKTPLTTIKSFIQILLSKAKKESDPFTLNALTRADVQTRKMTSMIQDFLSLARIEEGKISLEKELFQLHHLMEDVVAETEFTTPEHTIKLVDCDDITVFADRDKIGQVLINLLTNAVKYSPSHTTIVIGCEKLNGEVKIFVKDQGIGISSEDQKKLFSRFYRVRDEKRKTISGFGIGLYIVSEILRHHDSVIQVESKENEGSTFFFSLQVASTGDSAQED